VLPVQNIAASVLADIIRQQPASPARTSFAWSVAVGPALARATTVELDSGTLTVRAQDMRWTNEISRARDIVLARVQQLLGRDAVRELRVIRPAHAQRRAPGREPKDHA
jgi:predicted nucleic acid-binding Zn ribbon protein